LIAFAGHPAVLIRAVLAGALCLGLPAAGEAQPAADAPGETRQEGAIPDASFDAAFEKYVPPGNRFSPFYSWDAEMALNVTMFRSGAGELDFGSLFQTVGTENLGSRVSIGGTGYILRLGYLHEYSERFTLSGGLIHLSSHLTRDLDRKLEEERARGRTDPVVEDPSEYNVAFVQGAWRFNTVPLTPMIEGAIEPVSFRFNGSRARYVRPIYIHTRWSLWRGDGRSIVADTRHEIGTRPVNVVALSLHLFARAQPDGRLQIFVTASPGHQLHVSPNMGGVRDGIAIGVRMSFRA
jgi:hypothetical protein